MVTTILHSDTPSVERIHVHGTVLEVILTNVLVTATFLRLS